MRPLPGTAQTKTGGHRASNPGIQDAPLGDILAG
jgi:hypothetical protein